MSHNFSILANEGSEEKIGKIGEARGFRTGEKIRIYSCYVSFVQDVVVRRSEGREGAYTIFPRQGEDFLYIIRQFPRQVDSQDIEELLNNNTEQRIRGNSLIKKVRYEPSGNLWIWMVVRKEKLEYLDFFLSCEE